MKETSERPDSMSALKALHHPDTERTLALVVDDCPNMRAFARIVIGKALPELSILEAPHPIDAIAQLSREGVAGSVAFVWSDKDMPRMDGIQLGQVLAGEEVMGHILDSEHRKSLKEVPKLMMTGSYNPGLARALVDDGIFHHVGEKGEGGLPELFKHIHRAIEMAAKVKERTQEQA